jgi:hypothetical protein
MAQGPILRNYDLHGPGSHNLHRTIQDHTKLYIGCYLTTSSIEWAILVSARMGHCRILDRPARMGHSGFGGLQNARFWTQGGGPNGRFWSGRGPERKVLEPGATRMGSSMQGGLQNKRFLSQRAARTGGSGAGGVQNGRFWTPPVVDFRVSKGLVLQTAGYNLVRLLRNVPLAIFVWTSDITSGFDQIPFPIGFSARLNLNCTCGLFGPEHTPLVGLPGVT